MWIPKIILDAAKKKAERDAKTVADFRVIQLSDENSTLKKEIEILKKKVARYVEREWVDTNIGDPIPDDPEKRRSYVGMVAGLHNEILRPKLQLMIANFRKLLDVAENPRDFDQALKGGSYALQELIRWGDLMCSEDQAYTAGQNPSSPEDKK